MTFGDYYNEILKMSMLLKVLMRLQFEWQSLASPAYVVVHYFIVICRVVFTYTPFEGRVTASKDGQIVCM